MLFAIFACMASETQHALLRLLGCSGAQDGSWLVYTPGNSVLQDGLVSSQTGGSKMSFDIGMVFGHLRDPLEGDGELPWVCCFQIKRYC